MNEPDHTLTVTRNEYGYFGECECSNPDFEGTGLVGWWAADADEVALRHGEHLDEVEL